MSLASVASAMSSVPAAETATLPLPAAFAAPAFSVPWLTVVPPLYVLALPVSASVPLPVLTTDPLPKMSPLNVVLVLSPPAVSVRLPRCTVPAPASEPIVSLPPRVRSAPLSTVTALVFGRLPPLTASVPALMRVDPA